MKDKRTRTTSSPTSPWSALTDQEVEERRRSGARSFKLLGRFADEETRIAFEEWKAEVLKARTLHEQQLKRESGLRSRNEARQQEAGRKGQRYRDIARQIYKQGPSQRRATPHRLAQLVRAELLKRVKKAPHVRTLIRHFAPKT